MVGSVGQCTLKAAECDFRWEIELALSDLDLKVWPLCFIKSAPGFICELHKAARLGQKADWGCQAEERELETPASWPQSLSGKRKFWMLVTLRGTPENSHDLLCTAVPACDSCHLRG